MATVLAILALFGSWLRTAEGKTLRVSSLVGSVDAQCSTGGPCSTTIRRSVLIRDMSQHEVDSIVAAIRAVNARRHK